MSRVVRLSRDHSGRLCLFSVRGFIDAVCVRSMARAFSVTPQRPGTGLMDLPSELCSQAIRSRTPVPRHRVCAYDNDPANSSDGRRVQDGSKLLTMPAVFTCLYAVLVRKQARPGGLGVCSSPRPCNARGLTWAPSALGGEGLGGGVGDIITGGRSYQMERSGKLKSRSYELPRDLCTRPAGHTG